MGQILTFYSYKGGVGRTMALANIAVLLSQKKKKVLIVDWDLEAPGLEYYFRKYINIQKVAKVPGVINLLNAHNNLGENSQNITWHDCVIKFKVKSREISLITSGRKDVDKNEKNYFSLVRNLDVEQFYEEKLGGDFIESLRNEWKNEYDYILIDSRTGVTDIGGICTIQLPDVLFLLFGANEQNLTGITEIAKKVVKERNKIPYDRFSLIIFPLSSRFDAQAEFETSQEWLNKFGVEFKDCFSNWLPQNIGSREFIEVTKIPYIPYFSFGEKLPAIEQGILDPTGLGFAYETIASLIANNFENIETILQNRGLISSPKALDSINVPLSKSQSFYENNILQLGKYRLDMRGMLSFATMLVSLGALSIALGGGLILIFDILDNGLDNSMDEMSVKLFVLAITFLFSWVTGLISIRGFKNRLYPIIVKLYIWGCLSAAGVLYIKIIQKLYLQEYDYPKLGKYVVIMLGVLFVLLCLHLLLEEYDPRPLSIPLLVISVVHLFVIVYHYVFDASGLVETDALYVIGDFMFFLLMIAVSGLMLMHSDILSPVRERIGDVFSRSRKMENSRNGVR